jgi:hypothetical protein
LILKPVLEEAAIGFELLLSEFDYTFASVQKPGIQFKTGNNQAYQKASKIEKIREFLFDYIVHALSPPHFVE